MASPISANSTVVNSNINSSTTNIHGVEVPDEFIDPVTCKIMLNPTVVFPSGNTYDRNTLANEDANRKLETDPLTRQKITSFAPNRIVKEMIDRFLNNHPDLKAKIKEEEQTEANLLKPVVYTLNTFAQLYHTKDQIVFKANQKIRFEGVDRMILWRGSVDPNYHIILHIVNDALIPYGMAWSNSNLAGFTFASNSEKKTYTYTPERDVTINIARKEIRTTFQRLQQRMIESGLLTLKLDADQPLVITDIATGDLKRIMQLSHFATYLNLQFLPTVIDVSCDPVSNFLAQAEENYFAFWHKDKEMEIKLTLKED